jgi:hypothetical protein
VPLAHSLEGHREVRAGQVEAESIEPGKHVERLDVELLELVPAILEVRLLSRHRH